MSSSLLAFYAHTVLRSAAMLLPTAALALVPGLLPAYAIGRRMRLSIAEVLVVAFAVSFSLLGAAAFAAWSLHASLEVAGAGYAVGAIVAGVLGWRWRGGETLRRSPISALLGVGVTLLALAQGVWMGFTGDVFYHLAAVRSLLVLHAPLVTDALYGTKLRALDPVSGVWHTALAVWSRATGLDVLAFWAPLGALAAGLFAVSFFWLVREIAEDERAALIATLVLLVSLSLDLRKFAYPNIGSRLLIFAGMAALVSLVERPTRAAFIAATAAAFSASLVHLATAEILYVFIGVLALCAALGVFLARRRGEMRSWAAPLAVLGVLGVVGLLTAPSLYERSRVALGGFLMASDGYDIRTTHVTLLRAFLFPRVSLPLLPRTAASLLALALGVLTIAMLVAAAAPALRDPRPHRLAGVAAGSMSFLLLQFPLVTLPALALFPYMLYRLAALTGYVRPLLGGWLLAEDERGVPWHRALGTLGLAATVALAVPSTATVLAGVPNNPKLPSVAQGWAGDVRYRWGEATLARFRTLVGTGYPRVASDVATGYYLAGLTPVTTVAVKQTHSPWALEGQQGERRRADMAALLSADATVARRSFILSRYSVDYVAVSSDTADRNAVIASLEAQPALFAQALTSRDLVVFRVR